MLMQYSIVCASSSGDLISIKVIAVYKEMIVGPTKPFTPKVNIPSAALAPRAWLYTYKERLKIMVIVVSTSF